MASDSFLMMFSPQVDDDYFPKINREKGQNQGSQDVQAERSELALFQQFERLKTEGGHGGEGS